MLGHLNGNLGVGGKILTSYANATADAGDTHRHRRLGQPFRREQQHHGVGGRRREPDCDLHGCDLRQRRLVGQVNNGTQAYDATLAVRPLPIPPRSMRPAMSVRWASCPATPRAARPSAARSIWSSSTPTPSPASPPVRRYPRPTTSPSRRSPPISSSRVAPTSGKAAGALALNGITSLGFLNNTTHASISIEATVLRRRSTCWPQQDCRSCRLPVRSRLAAAPRSAWPSPIWAQTPIPPPISATTIPISGPARSAPTIRFRHQRRKRLGQGRQSDHFATTSGRITAASVAAAISDPCPISRQGGRRDRGCDRRRRRYCGRRGQSVRLGIEHQRLQHRSCRQLVGERRLARHQCLYRECRIDR